MEGWTSDIAYPNRSKRCQDKTLRERKDLECEDEKGGNKNCEMLSTKNSEK